MTGWDENELQADTHLTPLWAVRLQTSLPSDADDSHPVSPGLGFIRISHSFVSGTKLSDVVVTPSMSGPEHHDGRDGELEGKCGGGTVRKSLNI